jgi:hypothetical protein
MTNDGDFKLENIIIYILFLSTTTRLLNLKLLIAN